MSLDIRQTWATWPLRGKWYRTMKLYVNGRGAGDALYRRQKEIAVTISPTGRSVQVHVDGQKWGPVTDVTPETLAGVTPRR